MKHSFCSPRLQVILVIPMYSWRNAWLLLHMDAVHFSTSANASAKARLAWGNATLRSLPLLSHGTFPKVPGWQMHRLATLQRNLKNDKQTHRPPNPNNYKWNGKKHQTTTTDVWSTWKSYERKIGFEVAVSPAEIVCKQNANEQYTFLETVLCNR